MSNPSQAKEDEPSKEAKEKAEHLKKNLDLIINKRVTQHHERKKRTKEFLQNLNDANLNDEQKKEIEIQYFLDQTSILRKERKAHNKMTINNFEVIKVIGKGAFGEVRIVKENINHNNNNNNNANHVNHANQKLQQHAKVYAMKTILKEMMIAKKQLSHIFAERDLMAESNNPWLVKLYYAFQDQKFLYLVMEYCGGGDLMGLLIKKDILTEETTAFYMSELAAAINYVHHLGYVHRDLKPDNILIANDGHIRLSDFGLAKSFIMNNDRLIKSWQQYVATLKPEDIEQLQQQQLEQEQQQLQQISNDDNINININNNLINENKDDNNEDEDDHSKYDTLEKRAQQRQKIVQEKQLYSAVGTPDYIAIEVLYQKGYDKMVDWWSMGVIMFECLCGYAPFHDKDPLATCRKIVKYDKYFKIPKHIKLSYEARDLMSKLVCPAKYRMGWNDIIAHPWFKSIPWNNLSSMKPFFIPDLSNEYDSKYFEQVKASEHNVNNLDQNIPSDGYNNNANRVWGFTYNSEQFEQAQQQQQT